MFANIAAVFNSYFFNPGLNISMLLNVDTNRMKRAGDDLGQSVSATRQRTTMARDFNGLPLVCSGPAIDISRGARRTSVGVDFDIDDVVAGAGVDVNAVAGADADTVAVAVPAILLRESKNFVKASPPKYVFLDTHMVSDRWTSYHNYIGRFWNFKVDPETSSFLYLMVSEGGNPLTKGMRLAGRVLRSALKLDGWPPQQMFDSPFPFILPVLTATSMNGLVHLDVDKMMSCQVRASSKEMTDYKNKSFDFEWNSTPDYHLLRPFFHHLLENVTEMQQRTDLIGEFLDCWPNNVRM
jgi:hypothetical protein